MRRRFTTAVILVCLALPAAPRADEDYDDLEQIPSCGQITGKTALWQSSTMMALAGFSQTKRDYNGCLSLVRVEAWINGRPYPNTTLQEDQALYTAAVYWVHVPVSSYGVYTAQAKHLIANGGVRILMDNSVAEAEVKKYNFEVAPIPPEPDPEEEEPAEDVSGLDPDSASPVLIDTAHDGYHLTSVADGVLFDIDADGDLDRIAWTRPDSDDAWLALDRNGNGIIDSGAELFGNRTPAYPKNEDLVARNGFVALDYLQGADYGASYADRAIDARDAPFSRLLLWRDRNHDGISQRDELEPLVSSGIARISLDYKESRKRDRFGNEFRQRAKATFPDGEFFIYDVWLRRAR